MEKKFVRNSKASHVVKSLAAKWPLMVLVLVGLLIGAALVVRLVYGGENNSTAAVSKRYTAKMFSLNIPSNYTTTNSTDVSQTDWDGIWFNRRYAASNQDFSINIKIQPYNTGETAETASADFERTSEGQKVGEVIGHSGQTLLSKQEFTLNGNVAWRAKTHLVTRSVDVMYVFAPKHIYIASVWVEDHASSSVKEAVYTILDSFDIHE